ncbi:MAG: histidinol-phosphate transaminase [Alphaproteobacteria bacterium]
MDIAPYVPGAQGAKGQSAPARLASNENPLGCSPQAREAYRALAGDLHLYPDGGALALREAIAAAHGLEADRIVCGTGSDELIGMLTRAYAGPGDRVVYSQYGFLMYPISALAAGARPVAVPEADFTASVDNLIAGCARGAAIVFLANPNNPTGTWLPSAELRRLRASLPPDVLLVLDSAYAEYMDSAVYEAGAHLVRDSVGAGDNVVMLRTFSKLHGLAALRLGWAYCPPAVADVLNRVRGPFNVSAAAQAAGIAALSDRDFAARSIAHNAEWRPWLADGLRALGLQVPGDAGNFVLARFPSRLGKSAAEVNAWLAARGILVRPVVPYGLSDALRITVGLVEQNRAVVDAIRACLEA